MMNNPSPQSLFIPVILGSTRRGRQSAKVAHFVTERLRQRPQVEAELIDLLELNLPIDLGMGAFPIPAALTVSKVQDSFDAAGSPQDPGYEKRAQAFIDEVLWFAEAISMQKARTSS